MLSRLIQQSNRMDAAPSRKSERGFFTHEAIEEAKHCLLARFHSAQRDAR